MPPISSNGIQRRTGSTNHIAAKSSSFLASQTPTAGGHVIGGSWKLHQQAGPTCWSSYANSQNPPPHAPSPHQCTPVYPSSQYSYHSHQPLAAPHAPLYHPSAQLAQPPATTTSCIAQQNNIPLAVTSTPVMDIPLSSGQPQTPPSPNSQFSEEVKDSMMYILGLTDLIGPVAPRKTTKISQALQEPAAKPTKADIKEKAKVEKKAEKQRKKLERQSKKSQKKWSDRLSKLSKLTSESLSKLSSSLSRSSKSSKSGSSVLSQSDELSKSSVPSEVSSASPQFEILSPTKTNLASIPEKEISSSGPSELSEEIFHENDHSTSSPQKPPKTLIPTVTQNPFQVSDRQSDGNARSTPGSGINPAQYTTSPNSFDMASSLATLWCNAAAQSYNLPQPYIYQAKNSCHIAPSRMNRTPTYTQPARKRNLFPPPRAVALPAPRAIAIH